jgi:ribosomal protein S19E (S16A)
MEPVFGSKTIYMKNQAQLKAEWMAIAKNQIKKPKQIDYAYTRVCKIIRHRLCKGEADSEA